MPITESEGKKFVQLNFTAGSGDSWTMSQDMLVRSVRLTAPPTKLAVADYVVFGEAHGASPRVFVLSNDAKATFFHGAQTTKLSITSYSLTNPTDVVVSIEVD